MTQKEYDSLERSILVLGVTYRETVQVILEEMLEQIKINERENEDLKDRIEALEASGLEIKTPMPA